MGIFIGILMCILMGILMRIFMGILMGIFIGILMGILMEILMMDSIGWPYDSFDCLSVINVHDSWLLKICTVMM